MGRKIGRGGKHPIVCEVCPDRLEHGRTIQVGRKQSGYPRMIHDRAKCKHLWESQKSELMARWPETKAATKLAEAKVDEVVRAARRSWQDKARRSVNVSSLPPEYRYARDARTGRKFREQLDRNVAEATAPVPGEAPETFDAGTVSWTGLNQGAVTHLLTDAVVKLTPSGGELYAVEVPIVGEEQKSNGEGPAMQAAESKTVLARIQRTPTPELMTFVNQWFAEHGYQNRTSGVELWAVLTASHPKLLIDKRGNAYPRDQFLSLVRGIGLASTARSAPVLVPAGPDSRDSRIAHLEAEVARVARLATVQQQLIAAVARLVHKGNLDALETLLNLVETEDAKP
jgi:hypothetical protein